MLEAPSHWWKISAKSLGFGIFCCQWENTADPGLTVTSHPLPIPKWIGAPFGQENLPGMENSGMQKPFLADSGQCHLVRQTQLPQGHTEH